MKSIFSILIILFLNNDVSSQNTWATEASLPGSSRYATTSFVLGEFAYIIGGQLSSSNSNYSNEVWKYSKATDSWIQMNDFPIGLYSGSSFVLNGEVYVGLGLSNTGLSDVLYKYNQLADSWTNVSIFPGQSRYGAVSFVINNKGYICTGGYYNDLWEYDPFLNTWAQKSSLPSSGRKHASGFAIDGKGYLTNGKNGSNALHNDTWEYDPSIDTWTQRGNIGSLGLTVSTSFIINNTAYCATGWSGAGSNMDEVWAFDSTTGNWTFVNNISNLPNLADRRSANGFSISNTAYIFGGFSSVSLNDLWSFTDEVLYTTIDIDTTVCDLYVSPSETYNWDQSGNYTDTIANIIYNIDLEVENINPNVQITSGSSITSLQNNASYQWINCEDLFPIPGEVNQSFTPLNSNLYAVIISNNGCIDTSECISVKAVSIDEYQWSNVHFYPNPSTGTFMIDEDIKIKNADIYNSIGQNVAFSQADNLIELVNPIKGIYFIKLVTDDNRFIYSKVLIKR